MEDLEEQKLIEKAKKDPEAFGELFEKYYEPILNYILKRTGSIQVAQDITSQVFFLVVKKLWQFRWKGIPFSAWLYRITNNEIAYFYRKNKNREISLETLLEKDNFELADSYDLEEDFKEAEEVFEKHQDFLLIQKKLLLLPLKYQEVLTLKYFESKKSREIGLIIGKKENTVKSLIKRGLALLEEKVKQEKITQPISFSVISEDEQS